MLLRYSLIALLSLLMLAFADTLRAEVRPVSSSQLIQNAQAYDAEEIIYEGEVVGELMPRRGGVWANISDGENAIGVWMTAELAAAIKYTGSYKTKGDCLRVTGIFNRACPEHAGTLDIHALSVQKTKTGWHKTEKPVPAKRSLVVILLVILCLVLILKISIIR